MQDVIITVFHLIVETVLILATGLFNLFVFVAKYSAWSLNSTINRKKYCFSKMMHLHYDIFRLCKKINNFSWILSIYYFMISVVLIFYTLYNINTFWENFKLLFLEGICWLVYNAIRAHGRAQQQKMR